MKEKTIKSETIFNGKVIDVYRDQVELENGMKSIREVVHNDGGVCVLALTQDKKIVLVKQFRYPSKEELYELPGGRKEEHESLVETGKRELKEETGYVSEDVSYFGCLYPTVAYCDEVIHIVLAKNCRFERQCLDEGEFVDVELFALEELKEMILNHKIKDGKTLVGLLKYFAFHEN